MIAVLAMTNLLDFAKISNTGQYVYADRRPLSVFKGVAKDLVKLFKSYIRSASYHGEGQRVPVDPFLCLHIYCPPGSYDVNIEPSKDDVLFGDTSALLLLVEGLFRDTYGERITPEALEQSSLQSSEPMNFQQPDCFKGLAGKHKVSRLLNSRSLLLGKDTASTQDTPGKMSKFTAYRGDIHINMNKIGTVGGFASKHLSSGSKIDGCGNPRGADISNPWILAKFNASVHVDENFPKPASNSQLLTSIREREIGRASYRERV